jgi:hypothetical protein
MISCIEQVCSLGHSRYLIAPASIGSVSIPDEWSIKNPYLPLPVTIIRIDGVQLITSSWLQKTIDDMLASDDVFCRDFLSFVLFQTVGHEPWPKIVDDGALRMSWPNSAFHTGSILSGPYILMNSSIHRVFKMLPDPYGAFMYGVVQSEEDPQRSVEFRSF